MENVAAVEHGNTSETNTGISHHKLGMLVFITSEIMFFGGLIGSYVVFRFGNVNWNPPAGVEIPFLLPFINTLLLVTSSFTLHIAEGHLFKGNQSGFKNWLLFTVLLGTTFLTIQGIEYSHLYHEGMFLGGPQGTLFGASFYVLTGFHGLHVTGGVIYLLFIYLTAFKGKHTVDNHFHVEMGATYWHFVDIVWIFLFTILYVIK